MHSHKTLFSHFEIFVFQPFGDCRTGTKNGVMFQKVFACLIKLILLTMAIKYKCIQKTQPGVVGGGVKKYYASVVVDGEVTVDDLVKEIEKFSALSEPDIRGVIVALENVIQTKLANSKKVLMEKLGTFYPAIQSEGRDKEEEVNSHAIRGVGVNYRPGARILATMRDAGTKKAV
jgi:predicted histone-like DNA-binding protein